MNFEIALFLSPFKSRHPFSLVKLTLVAARFEEYRFGNVHETSLKEMFESDKYWNIVEQMKDFDVHNDCVGACRQDKVNEFLFNYQNGPKGVNFI